MSNEGGDYAPVHNGSGMEQAEAAPPFAVSAGENTSGPVTTSLFERIQQQKNQQSGQPPAPAAQPGPFGYPMAEDMNYSSSGPAPVSVESGFQPSVPQYSSSPRPNYYDDNTDYKSKMMDFLSNMGNAAVNGAKNLVGGNSSSGGGRMGEMNYQSESLLMDPHDLEDRAVPVSTSGRNTATRQTGMIGGLNAGNNSVMGEQDSGVLGSILQFLVDVKDLFFTAPRYAQGVIVGLFVLIAWLLFS